MKDRESIECRICGEQTFMLGTKLCDNCWEVETRLRTMSTKVLSYFAEYIKGINQKRGYAKSNEGS